MRKLLFALLAASLITACSNSNTAETEKTETVIPASWQEFRSDKLHYNIHYPVEWTNTSRGGLDMFHPQSQEEIVKLGSVNVVTEDLGGDMSVDTYAGLSVQHIKGGNMHVDTVMRSKANLNGNNAEVLEYSMQTEGFSTHVKQYCMVKGQRGYVVTAAIMGDPKTSLTDSIAQTFKFTDELPE